jgi:hypothetical protein
MNDHLLQNPGATDIAVFYDNGPLSVKVAQETHLRFGTETGQSPGGRKSRNYFGNERFLTKSDIRCPLNQNSLARRGSERQSRFAVSGRRERRRDEVADLKAVGRALRSCSEA